MNLLPELRRCVALTLALAIPAYAQVAPAPAPTEEKVTLEAFTVTGSNIKRLDVEKVLPVTVLATADLEIRDASQPSELLTALPQVTGLPGNETATLGATARGDNASVSLRGIASGNTLLLLNGRRLVPHPISQNEASVPTLSTNVNTLPNRGLERVEILRDGASSIYGTDAVAGVVNYVTAKNFRGTELSLRYGETRYGDGGEYRATLTHGLDFAKGKGRAMITADFYSREAMYARDRAFSAESDLSYRAPAPWNACCSPSTPGLPAAHRGTSASLPPSFAPSDLRIPPSGSSPPCSSRCCAHRSGRNSPRGAESVNSTDQCVAHASRHRPAVTHLPSVASNFQVALLDNHAGKNEQQYAIGRTGQAINRI